jgi:glucose-1-phosphate thymidylyltransferase
MEWGELYVESLSRGFAWFDTGTHESLLEASEFVRTIQNRQGMQIACLEEIAFHNELIDRDQVLAIAASMSKTEYGKYLLNLIG